MLGSIVIGVIVVPVWLVMRLLGIDALDRTLRKDKESYWRKASITADSRKLDSLKSQWRS